MEMVSVEDVIELIDQFEQDCTTFDVALALAKKLIPSSKAEIDTMNYVAGSNALEKDDLAGRLWSVVQTGTERQSARASIFLALISQNEPVDGYGAGVFSIFARNAGMSEDEILACFKSIPLKI